MKKQLTMTSAMAAALLALPACSSNDDWNEDLYADADTAVCVDRAGERVDEDLCDDGNFSQRHGFAHYYVGRGGRIPYYGDSIHHRRFAGNGSFTPSAGAFYAKPPSASKMTRSAAVSRGGLGSSGRSLGRSGG